MRIAAQSRPNQLTGKARTGASAGAGAAFQSAFASGGVSSAAQTTGVSSLASVSSLVAIQEAPAVDDALTGRRRAVANAEEMLDLLDEIKVGLLSGGVSSSKLDTLSCLTSEKRAEIDDPHLGEVLDHISLRAQVELAKLGKI